ncbi:MAG TPA: hypothetical protein VKB34_12650 [Povalibacter sp.]|nr:hypothetical protein [Povalibacter sp.]
MKRPATRWIVPSCLLALGVAYAGGGGGIPSSFLTSGKRGEEPAKVQATIRLQPNSFALESVANKYRLIPIEISNAGEAELALSATRDQVKVITRTDEILVGSFQLSKLDRTFWDSLESWQQDAASYPENVPAGSSRLVFVYVPAEKLRGVPKGVDLAIASLGKTLELRSPPAMAN